MLCKYMRGNVGRWSGDNLGPRAGVTCVTGVVTMSDTWHGHQPRYSHLYLGHWSVYFPTRCQVSAKTICCHYHSRVLKQACKVYLVRKPFEIILLLHWAFQAAILGFVVSCIKHSPNTGSFTWLLCYTGSLVNSDWLPVVVLWWNSSIRDNCPGLATWASGHKITPPATCATTDRNF